MKTTLLCLATQKGFDVLQAALRYKDDRRLAVCTFQETNVIESFDLRIKDLATTAAVSVLPWSEFRKDPIKFLESHEIDSIVCIGWRYLVPDEAIRHLQGDVVIAHDSLLPRLRGFAPLPTALIIGEVETGVTFLRPGKAVDDGDILWQKAVTIERNDTIAKLIDKVSPLYVEGVCQYLERRLLTGTPQNHELATYSIWRDALDYRINWNESADRIERTVRALGPPYLGAQCLWDNKIVTLHQVQVVPDLRFAIRQPGKIWNLDRDGRPTVVCGQGLLKLLSASIDGQAVSSTILRQRLS